MEVIELEFVVRVVVVKLWAVGFFVGFGDGFGFLVVAHFNLGNYIICFVRIIFQLWLVDWVFDR
jgi:hypothetical protein